MRPNPVQTKSYEFSLQIIALYRQMIREREFVLARQLLKSGTSIGANVEEALAGQSRPDFLSKMAVASKEARECHYWLRLLRDSGTVPRPVVDPVLSDCDELVRLLTAIVKTTKESD